MDRPISERTENGDRGKQRSTKISVVVTSYNHEKYINQCLDSILDQKRTYDLEVILGDDCSIDKTRQIMQDYQEKYPDIFVLLPPTANLGIPRNIKRCLDACSGDYIAFCEGDDYWTDTHKLQKQSDFLESHPDYSLCFNALVLYFEDRNTYALGSAQLSFGKDTVTVEDLIGSNIICGFSTCMYRSSTVRKLPAAIFDMPIADWMFNMACGRLGKIGFIRDWMSVYRIHTEGAWSGKSPVDQCKEMLAMLDVYNQFFSYAYDEQFRKKKEEVYRQYVCEKKKAFGESDNVLGESVANLSKQRVTFIKRGDLLMRAMRNPGAAYKLLRTISLIMEWKVNNRYHRVKLL